MKTVSVHIVTYNSEADIVSCLEAVFAQTYPIASVIVVDNASTDGTPDKVSPFVDQVQLIRNPHNVGFAAAHNQAIQATDTAYCVVLNPDVILQPTYIEEVLNFAEARSTERIGSLTGKLLLASNPSIVDSCGLRMTKARRAFDLGAGEPSDHWRESVEVFGVSGAAALYNREMIEDITINGQFFDERFFAYKEDVDVAWRARLYGWKAYLVTDAIATHKRGWQVGKRSKQPLFVRRHSYINRYRMMIKNESARGIIKHAAHIVPYEFASLGYAILREPKLLGAWTAFLRDRKQLQEWRKTIQSSKRVPSI